MTLSDNNTTPAAEDNWSLAAFLASPRSQHPGFLIDRILPQRSLSMLAADSYTGKTFLATALGLAVARGESFLGFQTHQTGVLLIQEDTPSWDMGSVVRRLLNGGDVPPRFHAMVHEGFRLIEAQWLKRLGAYTEAHDIGLVIIDSIRSVYDGDENDSSVVRKVMLTMRAICEAYGASIVYLHHTPKPSQGRGDGSYRGSSVFKDLCDFQIALTATNVDEREKLLNLAFTKGRGPDVPREVNAMLTWSGSAARLERIPETSAPLVALSLEDVINRRLDKGPAFIEELIECARPCFEKGAADKTIRGRIDKHLRACLAAHSVESVRVGRKFRWGRVSQGEKLAA